MDAKLSKEYWNSQWRRRLSQLVVRHRRGAALRMLNRLIENSLPLFSNDPRVIEERRIAWLFKIDLLREMKQLSEALAWVCLECELNPSNVTAQALKEQLKQQLDLVKHDEASTSTTDKPKPDNSTLWEGVAGMREIKSLLESSVMLPLQFPDLYEKYKVPIPNGILLYGPPGCGKTFIVRKLATIIKYDFIEIKPSDLASIYVHGTQQAIGNLFKQAEEKSPCMIFIDEIDAFVPSRGEKSVGFHYSAEVNEFLTQLNECAKRRILVVGATNLLSNIDPAILRPGRMDNKIFIDPPDMEARIEAFKLYMKDRPQGDIDWIRIAEYSDCYTFAEIEHIVNEAARIALKARRNISSDDIINAISDNPASLTPQKIDEMRNVS